LNIYYTSGISFSIPNSGSRTLTLQQPGLSDLTSTFTLLQSDITTALGYTPLRNTTDSLTGNLGVSGNFSAASASFNSISLSTALGVGFGGTGITQTPSNGQLLIGNAGGYNLTSLTSGTNISILTGAGSITISSIDTTGPNNYVSSVVFTDSQANRKVLTLTREGLTDLTGVFSLSAADITTALGFTPLQSTNTAADKYLTSMSITTDLISQNVELEFLLQWSDSTSTVATTLLTPAVITTALGYVPQTNLGYTPLRNTTDTLTGNLGVSGNFSASIGSFSTIDATNSSIGTLTLTNALGLIYGGTGLTQTPANGQLLIGNAGGYSLSTLIAGSNVQITTGAGSITISSTDTTNPNNYVTGISFSVPFAAQRTLTLTRDGLSDLTATFTLSASDITLALGYTPLRNTTDTLTGDLGVSGAFSAATGSFTSSLAIGALSVPASATLGVTGSGYFTGGLDIGGNFYVNNAAMQVLGGTTSLSSVGIGSIWFPDSGFNLDVGGNARISGNFSAGASILTSLGVTNAFSAASGSITNNLNVGTTINAATVLSTISASTLYKTWTSGENTGHQPQTLNAYGRVPSSTYAGGDSSLRGQWIIAFRDTGAFNNQSDGGTLDSVIGQQIYWGIYPRTNPATNLPYFTPVISEAYGILLAPYLGAGTISTYAAIRINAEVGGLFDDATVASKFSILSANTALSLFAGPIRTTSGLSAASVTITSITSVGATTLCRNTTSGLIGNCSSLSNMKTDVQNLSFGLEQIMNLRPVEFKWKDGNNKSFGFLAEEAIQVNPMFGEYGGPNGELSGVAYMQLTSLLTKGIQEQQVQIQNLSNAVSSLNVSNLESLVSSLNNTLDSLSMSTENGALVVNSGLTVTGEALFNNATFTGDVAIGQMKFDSLNNDISISGMPCTNIDGTLNESLCNTQTLFVMKNKAGNINFFDGKVLINPNGEMTLEKITVGEVAAAKVSASEYEVMAGSDISGNTKILTGQNEVTILTSKVKENSKIFITPTGSLEGSSIYVDSKLGGVSFTVKLSSTLSKEIEFDWFILNSE
jgi:hypothetical protein